MDRDLIKDGDFIELLKDFKRLIKAYENLDLKSDVKEIGQKLWIYNLLYEMILQRDNELIHDVRPVQDRSVFNLLPYVKIKLNKVREEKQAAYYETYKENIGNQIDAFNAIVIDEEGLTEETIDDLNS